MRHPHFEPQRLSGRRDRWTQQPRWPLHLGALGALGLAGAAALLAFGPARAADTEAGAKAAAQAVRGKPQSGVSVTHSAPARIAVGETVVLRLRLAGVSSPEGATVEVRDPATQTTLFSAQLAQGEQRTVELAYTGRVDGTQFVNVTTTQAGRSTVHGVPLRVGTGELRLKPQGQRLTTASGEAVISLPAATPASGR